VSKECISGSAGLLLDWPCALALVLAVALPTAALSSARSEKKLVTEAYRSSRTFRMEEKGIKRGGYKCRGGSEQRRLEEGNAWARYSVTRIHNEEYEHGARQEVDHRHHHTFSRICRRSDGAIAAAATAAAAGS
jgi:hypothetical protein